MFSLIKKEEPLSSFLMRENKNEFRHMTSKGIEHMTLIVKVSVTSLYIYLTFDEKFLYSV